MNHRCRPFANCSENCALEWGYVCVDETAEEREMNFRTSAYTSHRAFDSLKFERYLVYSIILKNVSTEEAAAHN